MTAEWWSDLPQFRTMLPLPAVPEPTLESPAVVRFFDRVRYDLESDPNLSEFNWFSREYPRCYRHHFEHAEHRLRQIGETYKHIFAHYSELLLNNNIRLALEVGSYKVTTVKEVYWNFEAYLNALNSALDVLARCVGTAYLDQTPANFNRICARKELSGPVDVLRAAQDRWVGRMKDFRDCFAHYTPADTLLSITLVRYSDGWQVRGKIPRNPNARDISRFRYSRRSELFRYSVTLWNRMHQLDRKIADELMRLYKSGHFPKRTTNLFSLGQRSRY